MTEAEWLTSSDPVAMIKMAKARLRHRKLRLFAVACCHRIQKLLLDARSHGAIAAAEQYADGAISERRLEKARRQAENAHLDSFNVRKKVGSCLEWAAEYSAHPLAFKAAQSVSWMSKTSRDGTLTDADYGFQASIVRDIFGNPFHPVTFNPSWLTPNVVRLAQTIYDARSFDRMPELADALEAAGCDNEKILEHCRSKKEHVRGCWVVDGVLGKM